MESDDRWKDEKHSIDNLLADRRDLIPLCLSLLSFWRTLRLLITSFRVVMARKCDNKVSGVRLNYKTLENESLASSHSESDRI